MEEKEKKTLTKEEKRAKCKAKGKQRRVNNKIRDIKQNAREKK